MKLNRHVLWLLCAVSVGGAKLAFAEVVVPISAVRLPGESFEDAAKRAKPIILNNQSATQARGPSVYDSRVFLLDLINKNWVAEIESLEKLQNIFETYRDLRYLPDPNENSFLRRLSWLYPDDGCFARAQLFGFLTEKDQLPQISKIFAFGDLMADTPNHPDGFVSWWYHVAPMYKVADELYVLDPSVEPTKPLTRAEWGTAIGDVGENGNTTLQWSLCHAHAYDPSSECFKSRITEEQKEDTSGIQQYLNAERKRVAELGMQAESVLGDAPPWTKQASQ